MHCVATHAGRVLQLLRKNGWLRAGDLAHAGTSRAVLTRLAASGQLEPTARSLQSLADASGSEHECRSTVDRKVPQARFAC